MRKQPAIRGFDSSASSDKVKHVTSIPTPPAKYTHILLVEDDPNGHFLLKTVLEKSGYLVTDAWDGKEVLELLENIDFDLVLMDCMMPIMDGYETTAIIRDQTSKVRNHSIPVIALTGNAFREDRNKCLVAGMNDYLSKPISIKSLLAIIEKWTRR